VIAPKDGIRLEVEFTAEGVRAGFCRFIDQRSDDLKAMVGKFCDELAGRTGPDLLEQKIRQRVEQLWHQRLNEFIEQEARGRVYAEIEKLRQKINHPDRKRPDRKSTP
jgi:hypothetical protein